MLSMKWTSGNSGTVRVVCEYKKKDIKKAKRGTERHDVMTHH